MPSRSSFNHPLFIMYSSGMPKCIVHGAGGTLLQHLKEYRLHCDIRPGDRMIYFTTCSWMMWNWLISGLASEAELLLHYDGWPFERQHPFRLRAGRALHLLRHLRQFLPQGQPGADQDA